MGAIEELATALLGGDAQSAIAAENPYAGLSKAGSDIAQLAINSGAKGGYSTKDILVPALLGGLTSGIFQGLGTSRQNKLTANYQDVASRIASGEDITEESSGLPPSLFRKAKDAQSMFKLQVGLQDKLDSAKAERDRTKAIDAQFADAIAKNPRQAERLLAARDKMLGIKQAVGMEVPTIEEAAVAPSVAQDGPNLGVDTLSAIEKKAFNENLDAGMPPVQAAASAREMANGLKSRAKQLYGTSLADEAAAISQAEEIISKGEEGIAKAGNTGSGLASLYEKAVSTFAPWETPEADRQVAGDALLNQTKQLGAMLNRIKGSGALSDFETKALFSTAMGADKPKAANEQILQSYKNGLALMKEHQDFMNYFTDTTGGNPEKAQTLWNLYKKENPILAKAPDGSVVPNPQRTPWQKFDFEGAYRRHISGEGTPAASAPTTQADPRAAFISELKAKGVDRETARRLYTERFGN